MKMQRLCSLLTAAGVLLASVPFAPELLVDSTLTAYAADEELLGPNHRWTLDDEGTLTITGTGAMRENIMPFGNHLDIVEDIKKVIISDGITSISSRAFSECTNLVSVTLPESLTSIGDEAFRECVSLTEINIPDSVTGIGNSAFYNCESLTEINIPDSITGIGNSAFYNCESLTEINIPKGLTSISDEAFAGCNGVTAFKIPNGVKSIGESAFASCTGLTEITVPDSVTSIGERAFSRCKNLTAVTLPDSITSIGTEAFEGTPWLDEKKANSNMTVINNVLVSVKECSGAVVIPDGVTCISNFVFYSCSDLTSVKIPDSVKSIGMRAFYGCSGLTEITIPGSVEEIGMEAFGLCSNLTKVRMGSGVSSIGPEAFYQCKKLTSVTMPDSLRSIGCSAFWECVNLTGLVLPEGLTDIGDTAFYGCNGLTEVTVPASVENLGGSSFAFCKSLTSVSILNSMTKCVGLPFSATPWEKAKREESPFLIENGILLDTTYDSFDTDAVVIPDGVVSIAGGVFKGCEQIPSIAVPDSVKIIGDAAFYQCKSITEINLPEGLISIGEAAFYECENLTDVTIPDSVTEIGEEAFEFTPYQNAIYANNYFIIEDNVLIDGKRCEGIAVIPEGVIEIGDEAFSFDLRYWGPNDVVMPNTVTYIGRYAFEGSRINEPHIPDSVTFIDDCAFRDCGGFMQVSIPGSVKAIADQVFYHCTNLCYVTLAEGVEYISKFAFANCEYLREIIIPESVTYIAGNAFNNDEKLTIKGIAGSYAETYAKEHKIPFESISSIPVVTMPAVTTAPITETETTTTTTTTAPPVNRSAFKTIEAESADVLEGIYPEEQSEELTCIGYIENGDYAIYRDVDFGSGAVKFMILASGIETGTVELHLDGPEGELIGSITDEPTGDWFDYRQIETEITPTDGVHDLCLLFKGDGEYVMNVDSFVFAKEQSGSTLYGDMNQDGSLSVADAVLLARFISEDTTLTDGQIGKILDAEPDFDGDGLVTILDVAALLKKLGEA